MPDPDPTVCPNCATPHGPDDVFCENCGYDFLTGSLPQDQGLRPGVPDGMANAAPAAAGGPDAGVEMLVIEVVVDAGYFASVVADGQLDLPDPIPSKQVIEVPGSEAHIGRTSASRNVHPDLDLAALTGDPAVSTRHAVIRLIDDAVTVTDVGSTNGTTLGLSESELSESEQPESETIAPNSAVRVPAGTSIFVGAWTRLTVL